MPGSTGLAQVSNVSLLAALLIYSLAVLAYAGDFAYGRPAAADRAETASAAVLTPAAARGGVGRGATAQAGRFAEAVGRARSAIYARPWLGAGVGLTVTGLAVHAAGVVARGLAVHRLPWGDMYEYATAITCVTVLVFLAYMIRYRAWGLGLFVMGAVVLGLGIAETVIYTPAGPLVPALQSYWLAIHVTAMTAASGAFLLAAVLGAIYLAATRRMRTAASETGTPMLRERGAILRRLPAPDVLDRLAYRTVVFGFPIWTFGVMAGAIWANQAWGRYWGWDPVETWSFITWLVYAAYLHARATAGWRGRRAAWIQLAGFGCLLFNMIGVQVFITGLHSYSGVG